MASIQIANLHKSYGNVSVLKEINFSIDDGEFVILVGPSGCGKSTLLRVISGLEAITSGEIRIDDQIVNALPAKDRNIAMVFQNYALYPHMTVADNMGFSMKMRGEKKEVIKVRVDKAAAILGLEPLMQRRPSQLSGGQRQRVAMGRAIVRDPKVFLFDEPLSNLDAKLRVQMRTEIKALHQRLKTTMVYVTHDQIEAMTMADRIVVMRDGVVEQIGRPLELYDRPKNTFVASFIGSPGMNLIEGVINGEADPSFEIAEGMQLVLPNIKTEWSGRRCTYGVRPEDVMLHPDGIAARVVAVEPTGPETHILVRAAEHMLTCVLRERTDIKVGQTVGVKPQVSKIHLFDAGSGERLEV